MSLVFSIPTSVTFNGRYTPIASGQVPAEYLGTDEKYVETNVALFNEKNYDKDFEITADVTSLMWCNGSQIVIKPTKCPTVYISNKSKVRLVCDGYNTVNVKLFDESKLIVEDIDENSEIIVYKYSDKATVEEGKYCFGKVKVFNKELRL